MLKKNQPSIYPFTFMYSKISLMQVSDETLLIGEIIYMSYFHFKLVLRRIEKNLDPFFFLLKKIQRKYIDLKILLEKTLARTFRALVNIILSHITRQKSSAHLD